MKLALQHAEAWSKILAAYGAKKTIQCCMGRKEWEDLTQLSEGDLLFLPSHFRVKPEPQYVPWTPETVPLGTVVIHGMQRRLIIGCSTAEIAFAYGPYSYEYVFTNMTREDGSPCGTLVS